MRRQTNEQIFRPQKTVMNKRRPADGPSKLLSRGGCGRSTKTQEVHLSHELSSYLEGRRSNGRKNMKAEYVIRLLFNDAGFYSMYSKALYTISLFGGRSHRVPFYEQEEN